MIRSHVLVCGGAGCLSSGCHAVQEALVALYPKWSRVARGGNVDAYANRVLFGKHVDGRRRPWRWLAVR